MRGALVPIKVIAKANGVSPKTMKRRLKRMDERLGGDLLVRMGRLLFADLEACKRHHVIATEEAERSGDVAPPLGLDRILEEVLGVHSSLADIKNDVAAMRDMMVDKCA